MAHFAELDENNIVLRVIVISNDEIINDDGLESEALGIERCVEITGGGRWVQTSYNNNFRIRYAGIGMKYFEEYDGFGYPEAPYPSWSFNTTTLMWDPPKPHPGGMFWEWDEESFDWVKFVNN